MGVYSLSFDYTLSRYVDQFGNVFRYKARVNPKNPDSRWMYDVWLNSIPVPAN